MAVFIDTGVFVALRNADDELRTRSKELMKRALVKNEKTRPGSGLGKHIIEPPRISKLWTAKDTFDVAWKKFKNFKDQPLSFTDCVSSALMEKYLIKQIISFDSGFDGLIQRIY